MVKETIFVPAVEYTIPFGFCTVDVEGVEPEAKFHSHDVPAVVPVFVKSTDKPVHLGAVDVKFATGVELIVIALEKVVEHPNELTVVKVIIFAPAEKYAIPLGLLDVEF